MVGLSLRLGSRAGLLAPAVPQSTWPAGHTATGALHPYAPPRCIFFLQVDRVSGFPGGALDSG